MMAVKISSLLVLDRLPVHQLTRMQHDPYASKPEHAAPCCLISAYLMCLLVKVMPDNNKALTR